VGPLDEKKQTIKFLLPFNLNSDSFEDAANAEPDGISALPRPLFLRLAHCVFFFEISAPFY
jgi:hypothetical protein